MTTSGSSGAPELASSDQARTLLEQVKTLTARGNDFSDRHTYGHTPVELPSEVTEHLPPVHPQAIRVVNSSYSSYILDPIMKLRKSDATAIITFTRKELHTGQRLLAAHVNYHIITDDGSTYRLERHVTNTEHGPHKVRELRAQRARLLYNPRAEIQARLTEVTGLRDRVTTTRSREQALGLNDVTSTEANQIIAYISELNQSH